MIGEERGEEEEESTMESTKDDAPDDAGDGGDAPTEEYEVEAVVDYVKDESVSDIRA